MSDLPSPWESFLGRAKDYLAERDFEEAQWSAERALHYLQTVDNPVGTREALLLLGGIAELRGEHELAAEYRGRAKQSGNKSLWQHLRES